MISAREFVQLSTLQFGFSARAVVLSTGREHCRYTLKRTAKISLRIRTESSKALQLSLGAVSNVCSPCKHCFTVVSVRCSVKHRIASSSHASIMTSLSNSHLFLRVVVCDALTDPWLSAAAKTSAARCQCDPTHSHSGSGRGLGFGGGVGWGERNTHTGADVAGAVAERRRVASRLRRGRKSPA